MVDLCVEFLCMWVRRGRGAESVSVNNESFDGFSEFRYHVMDVTLRMWCFAEVFWIFQNRGSPVLQVEGNLNRAKDSSASRVY